MKLSVALCTYNGEKFLKKQLDSILNQSVAVDEIVICDDGSTDATVQIVTDYKLTYPNVIQLFINEVNLRSNKNFEKAVSLCSGDYIFLSDQDDIWRSDKVAKTLDVFNQNPAAEGVFSNASFMDENDNPVLEGLSLWSSVNFFPTFEDKKINLYTSLTQIGNFLTGATFCMKKEVKSFCFPFLNRKNFFHDEWLAFILSERNTLFYSTENLISYRIHSNQQLGVGSVKSPIKKLKKNLDFNSVMLGHKKPSTFRDFKYLTRTYFYQLQKYNDLYNEYKDARFLNTRNKLASLYLDADTMMKKNKPVFYYLRKLADKMTGKRQLDTSTL
jgi:glycosyltransferase involved in cell wall biosynthesis